MVRSKKITGNARAAGNQDGANSFEHLDISEYLEELGLCLKEIEGDGNCLFRSLADQYYGSPIKHLFLREKTCEYILGNREEFEPFIDETTTFERYVSLMKKRGVYGGNLELVAFARCFDVDIKVYQAGGTVFLIDGSSNGGNSGSGTNRLAKRRQLHIAYHDYEHYSSIREKEDTGDGIPEFKNESMSMNQQFSSSGGGGSINMMLLSEENRKKMKSKVKIVIQATDLTSEEVATNLLIKHNWDVDSVIDEVYMSSISNENGIAGEKNEHEEELEPESEQHQKNENQGSGIGDKVGLDADIDKKNPKKCDSKEKEKEKEKAIVTEKGMRRQKDKKNKTAKTIQEPTNTEGANVKNNKKEHTAQGHQSGYVSNRQKKIEAKRRQKEQSRIKKTQGKKNTALDGMRADKGGEKESDVTGKLTLLHI